MKESKRVAIPPKVDKATLAIIQGVSYPRSGHHLLVNCLLAYFGENPYFQRTDGIKPIGQLLGAWNFNYCDYYHHCNQVPCSHPATRFQKHHDYHYHWDSIFDENDQNESVEAKITMGSTLDPLRSSSQSRWIVQYRNPVDAIVSYYILKNHAGKGFTEFSDEKKRFIRFDDTETNWQQFAMVNKRYWLRFIDRWVKNPQPHSLLIRYEDLINHPLNEVRKAIQFFNPESTINEDFLAEVIEAQDIRPKSQLKNFKYYDPKFLKLLEELSA